MVTAERSNKYITSYKEHFILLKNKLNYRNTTNNNQNDDDFDFDSIKPTTENENNPSPPIRRYPVRTRNRPTFYQKLTGCRDKNGEERRCYNVTQVLWT